MNAFSVKMNSLKNIFVSMFLPFVYFIGLFLLFFYYIGIPLIIRDRAITGSPNSAFLGGLCTVFMVFALIGLIYTAPSVIDSDLVLVGLGHISLGGKIYEIVDYGSFTSINENGAGSLGFMVLCFFKNLIVCPILIIVNFVKMIICLLSTNYAKKINDSFGEEGAYPEGGFVNFASIMLYIASAFILFSSIYTIYWMVFWGDSHSMDKNITIECTTVERIEQNLVSTVDGSKLYKAFISFEINYSSAKDNLSEIDCEIIFSDGINVFDEFSAHLNGNYSLFEFTYMYKSKEAFLGSKEHLFNLDNFTVKVNVRKILYDNGSVYYEQEGANEFNVPINLHNRDSNLLIFEDGIVKPKYNTITEATISSIMFNTNITEIGTSSFYNNSFLKKVIINEGITKIDNSAFYMCNVLTDIYLPSSIKEIGKGAFIGCNSLKNIYFNGTMNQWKNITKDKYWLKDSATIYTPPTVIHCTDGDLSIYD